jgi:hypothetical protein
MIEGKTTRCESRNIACVKQIIKKKYNKLKNESVERAIGQDADRYRLKANTLPELNHQKSFLLMRIV